MGGWPGTSPHGRLVCGLQMDTVPRLALCSFTPVTLRKTLPLRSSFLVEKWGDLREVED